MQLRPLELKDCYKTFRHDQDKARNPEETLRWVKERLQAQRLNILTETVRIDTGRLGIPVFISLCGDDAIRLTGTKKQMGKGATPAQSEASAVMELMERFSFFSYIHQAPFSLRPFREVAGQAVSPALLSRSVYDNRTDPARVELFLQDCPLRWAPAFNLTRSQPQWVPIDWFYLINEYNGPAAGNTLEEAILQSLCEVVERHVGSVISHEQSATPLIDPASLQDPAAHGTGAQIPGAGHSACFSAISPWIPAFLRLGRWHMTPAPFRKAVKSCSPPEPLPIRRNLCAGPSPKSPNWPGISRTVPPIALPCPSIPPSKKPAI